MGQPGPVVRGLFSIIGICALFGKGLVTVPRGPFAVRLTENAIWPLG